MISVIIITKNEEKHIRECLKSVQWADEIVVLDSGSTDGTVEICREFTDQVFKTDWPGFGPQKNRALAKTTGDWILSVDADERISPELRVEIEQAVKSEEFNGYEIPRASYFCGQRIHHSGWWPDHIIRLFRRDSGKFSDTLVHEVVNMQGSVGRLRTPIIHYSYDDMEEVLDKVNRYSTYNAEMLLQAGKKSGLLKAVGRGLWAFMKTYFLRAGFLDGKRGFMIAVSNAEGTYYKYIKLTLLLGSNSRINKEITPRISVILSTYNSPDVLEMVLRSLETQTCRNFEIIVADDGSNDDTRQMIHRFQSESQLIVKQVWHEDEGFRAAAIRNKAVAASREDYLVFLDGDCMVFPDFLAEHVRLREPRRFTTGNRMLLNRELTEETLNHKLPLHQWTYAQWTTARFRGQTNRLLPLLRLPLGFLRKLRPRKWFGVKTCNLGMWRQDFLDVNGFDERYQGWGYEDSDLVIRIMNNGVFRLEGRFAIPVIHLWHPSNNCTGTQQNLERLQKVMHSNITRIENGVDHHRVSEE